MYDYFSTNWWNYMPLFLADDSPSVQLHGVDDNIGKSKRVMTAMSRRMSRNKWIIGSIIAVLVIAIGLILYFKLAKWGPFFLLFGFWVSEGHHFYLPPFLVLVWAYNWVLKVQILCCAVTATCWFAFVHCLMYHYDVFSNFCRMECWLLNGE